MSARERNSCLKRCNSTGLIADFYQRVFELEVHGAEVQGRGADTRGKPGVVAQRRLENLQADEPLGAVIGEEQALAGADQRGQQYDR